MTCFPSRARLFTAASATTLALSLSLSLPSLAHAACTVDGMPMADASSPMSGQTITCADNLDNDGVVNAEAQNVTVDITAPAGGISTTGAPGVVLGNGATVSVAAGSNRPINTSGDNAAGVEVGNDSSVTVGGQVTTAGGMSGAVRTGDGSTVDVSGTVRTGGGMSDAVSVGADSTVTAMTGALITTGNSNSNAVTLRGANSTLNVMADADITTSSGMSNPVLISGDMGTVNVMGEVRSSSGNSTAILATGDMGAITVADGGFVTAQSSGSNAIESTGMGADITIERGGEVVISSGNSAGIVAGPMGTVDISGMVMASSSQSQGVILGDGSTLNVMDMGVIRTSSSGSQAVLVNADAMTATIDVMEGGDIDAIGAQAILDEGMTDTTVTIDGRVFGGSSEPTIDLGMGDDSVTINGTVEGSSAEPVISAGAGMDTLTVNGADSLTGPGVLADLGEGMMDVLNLNGGMFMASRFEGAETVNVGMNASSSSTGEMGGMGDMGGMGGPSTMPAPDGMGTAGMTAMSGTYTVDANRMMQTVNASGGSTVDVTSGGSIGTVNNMGGMTNVGGGGMAMETNASMGGTTNVNEGGTVMNANASDGGTTNVDSGGTAMNTTAGDGGTVNVGSGGDAGRVQSDMGGNVTVGSGGSANVDAGSGNGGNITFQSGSNANVEGSGSRRTQSELPGVDFQSGSGLTVTNSPFLSATGSGSTLEIGVTPNAFINGAVEQGVTNANALNAAAGLDAIAQAQTDVLALNEIDNIIFADASEIPTLFNQISGEGTVQTAVAPVFVAGQFTDMLRAGANPLAGSGSPTIRTASRGAVYAGDRGNDGSAGVWASVGYGAQDIDGSADITELEVRSNMYAAGIEGRIDLPGLDEGAVGIGVGYTFTDVNSASIPDGDVESVSAGIYAGGTRGPVRADFAATYTNSDIEAIDGSDTKAHTYTGRIELSADVFGDANRGFNLAPLVRLEGTIVEYGEFDPVGPTNTVFQDEDFEQGVVGVGARIGYATGTFGTNAKLFADLAYERVFGDEDLAFSADIGSTTGAFRTIQNVSDEDRLHAGAGVGVEISDTADIAVRYDGRYGADVEDHRGSVRATVRF